MIDKLYLIPDHNDIKRSEEIADKWEAAFEYNDFFDPKLLDFTISVLTVATKR